MRSCTFAEVTVHAGEHILEIHHNGRQVAAHARVYHGGHTTNPAHMAKAHRKHAEWSPQRFLQWAERIGPQTRAVIQHQLGGRRHPEHGYRACLGLLSLSKKYGQAHLEAACLRAVHIGGMNYKHIASILRREHDKPKPIERCMRHLAPKLTKAARTASYQAIVNDRLCCSNCVNSIRAESILASIAPFSADF